MLKKLGWGLFALLLLVGLARAAGDPGSGGMSINSLSNNITSALSSLGTAIGTAISSTAVQTVGPGIASGQAVPTAPQNGRAFPTSPLDPVPNIPGSGTITAANGYVSIPTGALAGLTAQISGTFVATLSATCSGDNDATSPTPKSFLTTGVAGNTTASQTTVSAPGNYGFEPGACDHIRITATSYTSGTITVTWLQTGAPFRTAVSAPIAAPIPGTEVGSQNAAAGIVPAFSSATGSAASNGVIAKAASGNLYDATALNTSSTPGYLVVLNLTALPAANAAITPLDYRPLYAGSASGPSFAEIDAKPGISCTTGCVAVMSASLTTYTPTLTGAVGARAR